MKYLILGPDSVGKTTVAEMITELTGCNYMDATIYAYSNIILKHLDYDNFEECYSNKSKDREEWKGLINMYNSENPLRLVNEVLEQSDIYTGLREERQIQAAIDANIFDLIIAVDIGYENNKFNQYADLIIRNKGSKKELRETLNCLFSNDNYAVDFYCINGSGCTHQCDLCMFDENVNHSEAF